MISSQRLPHEGIWPALLTPLTETLEVEAGRFVSHARRLLEAGCAGVTPFGTTGEGASFTVDERRAAIDALVAGGVPGSRILVSTSATALPDVVTLTRHAIELGAHGCLMLPPFFLKGVPDEGIVDAYRWVIDRVADPRLRLVLYHIPQVAGVGLSEAVIEALCTRYPDTILGIKDSGCQREFSLALAARFMPPLQVWVGNEPDLCVMAARGTRGAVSGVANLLPGCVRRLVAGHDGAQADADMARVQALLALMGGNGLIPSFKAALAVIDGHDGWCRVRPPLKRVGDGAFNQFQAQLRAFGLGRADD